MEGKAAVVAGREVRMRDHLALVADALEVARGQQDDLERDRPVVRDVAMHVGPTGTFSNDDGFIPW